MFIEIADNSESQTLATLVKKQKKSEKSMNSLSMRHMTMKTSSLIKLTDLTIEDQQYLLEEVKKQLLTNAQPYDYKLLNVEYKKEMYEIKYTVRYLHLAIRFAVKNSSSVGGYIITDSLIVSTKPGININLIKHMIEIVMNSLQTKE